jgi:hypothetical protein
MEVDMPKRHGLGFGNGKIVEYEDGTAGYIPTGTFTQAFRVQIADVTGFSVTKGGKVIERTLNVLGNGTLLASASVPHGTAEKVEQWFRAHPLFGRQTAGEAPTVAQTSASPPGTLIADELRKLADLRSEGILTDEEFAAQKALLLKQ